MKSLVPYVVVVGVLVACVAAQAGEGDWLSWRGPTRDGITGKSDWNPESLKDGPKIKWKADVGQGWSAVSVKGTKVYTTGYAADKESVFCLNLDDGKELWKHTYSCPGGDRPGARATPVIDDGMLYIVSKEGQVLCLDAETGSEKWTKDLNKDCGNGKMLYGHAGSACVSGDMVLFNACTHGVALNKKTGAKIWATPGAPGSYATPVLFTHGGKDLAAIFGNKALYVVETASGNKVASFDWVTKYDVNAPDPIISGDKIFITSGYGKGCALLQLSGDGLKDVWQNKAMRSHFQSSVLHEGHLYGIDGNSGQKCALRCLDFATGEEKWNQVVGLGSLILAEGKLIIIGEKGDLIVAEANPVSYKEIVKTKALDPGKGKYWAPPVLCRGNLFCRASEGQLLCIDVSK